MTNTANTITEAQGHTIAGEPPYSAQDALAIYEAAFSAGLEQGHRDTAHKLKFAADEIARHKAALDSALADLATADELRDYATRRNAYLEGELEAMTLDNETLAADIDAAEHQIEEMRARRCYCRCRGVVTEPGQPRNSRARQGNMFSRSPGRTILKAALLAAALFAFYHFARAAL